MGEVVHGNYNDWTNSSSIDSVTNYQIYKSLWSAVDSNNFFELSYNLDREFGKNGMYKYAPLYNFLENHDVNRLASVLQNPQEDLYLLYAECINEAEGPDGPHSAELFKYLDAIRSRAGIPDVKTAWEQYSNNPSYYKSKSGMRDIIHKERLNEFVFESQRFWDLRRWKEAPAEYYVKTFIAEQQFGLKDYFWPIPTSYIEVNPNLVQNLGW